MVFSLLSCRENRKVMDKKYYALKLKPNRADFAQTMTAEERGIMMAHVEYWKEYMAQGMMVVFGPVLDPKGMYGLGVACVDSEEQLKGLLRNDPASKINEYEYHPMLAVVGSDMREDDEDAVS